jgi:DNA modification methylase
MSKKRQYAIEPIPPLYYPTPNPSIDEVLTNGKKPRNVDCPYPENIVAGKNSYVYDAHTYHTKVPPEGIKKLIEYYTDPGDTILDPFCGSGMTGVAALETKRRAILSDISPAATFIAYNLNTPVSPTKYHLAILDILDNCKYLEKILYCTKCRTCGTEVPVLYTVWSYGLICASCGKEFILWDVARDERETPRESKILSEFDCPHCHVHIAKRSLKRTRRYPVQVGYKCCAGGLKEEVYPLDAFDKNKLEWIEKEGIPSDLWYPKDALPIGFNTKQPISAGIDTIDKAYTPRALWAFSKLWQVASEYPDKQLRPKLLFTLTSLYKRITVFSEFRFWGGSSNTANFNVPMIMNEQNVFKTFERKAKTILLYFQDAPSVDRNIRVTTQSSCNIPQLPDNSIDYAFTDPPFGSNINYSEMNFLWESWLGLYTDNREEAIVNKFQQKNMPEYQNLLAKVFCEVQRVLKPNAWFTIMFHNSSEKVWQALQQAISNSSFSIIGTQYFDKKHGTFKQFVSDNAVGYDLVMHCRKLPANNTMRVIPLPRSDIHNFVSKAIDNKESYITHYLHVEREDEIDFRKLYAEWLAASLPKGIISISFPEFRHIASQIYFKSISKSQIA